MSDDDIRPVISPKGKVVNKERQRTRPQDGRNARTTTREDLRATGGALHAEDEEDFAGAVPDPAEEKALDQETNTDARQGRFGRGLEWLPLEFVHFSKAFRSVTLESVKGTDQRAPQYEAAVADTFRGLLDKSGLRNIDKRRQRSTNATMRLLRFKVLPDVLKIKDRYLAVTRRKMMGSLTGEQMENAAIAYFNGHREGDLYAAGTRPELMATLRCKHMDSFKVLRHLDTFSTAVGMITTPPTVAAPRTTGFAGHVDGGVLSSSDDCDDDARQPRLSSRTKSTAHNSGHTQERPSWSEAAKAACRAEIKQQREVAALQRESDANTAALQALAASAQERSIILFWTSAEASKSSYAADFWKAAIAAYRKDNNALRQRSGSAHARAGRARSNEGEDNATEDEQVHRSESVAVEDAVGTTRKASDVADAENKKEETFHPHKAHDAAVAVSGSAAVPDTTATATAKTVRRKHSRTPSPTSRQPLAAALWPLLRQSTGSKTPPSSDDEEHDRRVGRRPAKWPRPTTSIGEAAAAAARFSTAARGGTRVAASRTRPPLRPFRGRASQATKQRRFMASRTSAAPAIDVDDAARCGTDTPSPPSSPPNAGGSSGDDSSSATA